MPTTTTSEYTLTPLGGGGNGGARVILDTNLGGLLRDPARHINTDRYAAALEQAVFGPQQEDNRERPVDFDEEPQEIRPQPLPPIWRGESFNMNEFYLQANRHGLNTSGILDRYSIIQNLMDGETLDNPGGTTVMKFHKEAFIAFCNPRIIHKYIKLVMPRQWIPGGKKNVYIFHPWSLFAKKNIFKAVYVKTSTGRALNNRDRSVVSNVWASSDRFYDLMSEHGISVYQDRLPEETTCNKLLQNLLMKFDPFILRKPFSQTRLQSFG